MILETKTPRPFRRIPEPEHDRFGMLTPKAVAELQEANKWNDAVLRDQAIIGKSLKTENYF
ncbi:MAG: hypothetical protein FJY77_06100 [Candidatus Altiarchaeales archaeon]|nr:hypothetical protein [Candidatus Altiarchaeales archaeon]